MARGSLLVEWSLRSLRTRIGIVRDRLITQCSNCEKTSRLLNPWPLAISIDFADRRSGIRISAIRMVISRRECGGRHDRSVKVPRLSWHERQLVAEVAVSGVI